MNNLSNYVKIEKIKLFVLEQLKNIGMEKQIDQLTEQDINTIIYNMGKVGQSLKELETQEQQIDYLILYLISLWTKLLVIHKSDPSDL